jgi:RimJ/RimL family protein N-acetyltransferase
MSESWFDQPILAGQHVRLEPLGPRHAEGLLGAADDPALFRWMPVAISDLSDAQGFIAASQDDPNRLAYAQVEPASGRVVGTTSYYQIHPQHRSLAIGYTFISRSMQRTAVNPEAKFLLLRRAFDELGAVRVEWHTDELNAQSRGAIAKLGAEFEGLLRKHRRRRDGSWRTTALFAMTDEDWPEARARLQARILG